MGKLKKCIRLSNGRIDLVATTDVGPRVLRLGFAGGRNLFAEYPGQWDARGGDAWRIFGGHRLWHAPEAKPRSYAPDNGPVEHEWDGRTLVLRQRMEHLTGIEKHVEIALDPRAPRVRVLHRLINRNLWDIEAAVWGLSVMAPGGRLVIPQEPFRSHAEWLLPARPVVLWHYTDMSDPRWTWGERFIQLRQDPAATTPQKIGVFNAQGWAAYALGGDVFLKRFPVAAGARYPDMGCNFETFTCASMLECESVGPLTRLAANGGTAEHVEEWILAKADLGATDRRIASALRPVLKP